MATLVYRYAVKTRVPVGEYKDPERPDRGRESARYELPEPVMEQVRLAHQMRNALVEIEQVNEMARRMMWSERPQVAEAEQQLADAEQQAAEAGQALKDARQKAGWQKQLAKEGRGSREAVRETEASRRAASERVKELRQQVRGLRQQRREAIAAAYEAFKPRLQALRADRNAAIKRTRQDFGAQGLHWASYNMVVQDHRVRVQLVERHRRQGRAAQLRFRRFDGSGTMAVQLQRAAGDPARAPQLLASGEGKWRNVLQLRPWMPPDEFDELPRAERGRLAREGELLLNVGGGRTVTLPVIVHRMMPPDADVAEASLTVERTAGQWTASVSLTVKVPDPAPVEGRMPIAVHAGWRSRDDGSVRVGTWHAPEPVTVPEHLDGIAVPYESGRWGEFVLPAAWVDTAGRPTAVQGQRDTSLEPVREQLAAWLDEHPQPDPTDDEPDRQLTGGRVRQWRAAGRFAALALRWRDQPPAGDGADEMVAALEAWRRQDRHLWEWSSHERKQITARRDNAWRLVGAWLADQAGALVVDDSDLAQLRRSGDPADDDPTLPEVQQHKARARAALSAPGRLRQLVTAAAERRGVTVRKVPAKDLSRTCPHCGHVGDANPRYAAAAVVTCPACVRTYDQDRSAAVLMLSREVSGGDPGMQ